jgi:DNA-binding NarL/FixJ family response regulator
MAIRVLLVDDHTIVRDGLTALLKSVKDIEVVGDAADGRQAIREVERLKPDVVIMDIAMPELNGIEATREICRINPSAKVVILSVYSTLDHISLALKAGAMGFLLKGSAAVDVVDAIHTVIGGHYFLCREIADLVIKEYVNKGESTSAPSPLNGLTSRERVILQMVTEGKTSRAIADTLGLATSSVEIYRSRMMKKLGVKDLPGLIRLAIQHGLTTLHKKP